jgi:hypothetical protein
MMIIHLVSSFPEASFVPFRFLWVPIHLFSHCHFLHAFFPETNLSYDTITRSFIFHLQASHLARWFHNHLSNLVGSQKCLGKSYRLAQSLASSFPLYAPLLEMP